MSNSLGMNTYANYAPMRVTFLELRCSKKSLNILKYYPVIMHVLWKNLVHMTSLWKNIHRERA